MEWKKVLRQKKIIGILIGLFFFHIFFFLYTMQVENGQDTAESDIAYMKEEQEKYIARFHESVEEKVKQADSMSVISIFSQTDSFSSRNLERTKEDFKVLLPVQPKVFYDKFLREFFSYSALNGIVVLCGVVVAMALIDENKSGLRSMIFASVNGRGRLVLEKAAALLLWAFIITVCFYGGTLTASTIFFQGELSGCLNLPIQSLSMFSSLPWRVGIGAFLLIYLCYRWMLLFIIMIIVWTLLYSIDHMLLAGGTAGVFGILAYLFYRLVGSSSPLNILKYCSLWYQVSGNGFFTEYKNLNIFSYALNKNSVIIAEWLFLVLLFLGLALLVGNYRYPCISAMGRVKRKLLHISKKVQSFQAGFQEKLSLPGMEYYKVLISQKGIVVIIFVIVVLVYQTDFNSVQLSGKQEMYAAFLDKSMGIPDKESQQEIDDLKKLLKEVDEELYDAFLKNEKGELSDWDLTQIQRKHESYEQHRNFLELLNEQTTYLKTLKQEKNIDGWYVNVYSYNHLLDDGAMLSNLFLIMGIVLLCSGIFSCEKKSGMLPVIRGSVNGRFGIFQKKMQVAFVLTFLLFLTTAALEITSVAVVYGLKGLEAPVQSLSKFSFVPVRCSIGVFFAGLYIMKAMMMFAVAAFTCMLSARTNQKFAIGMSFVLCIPELLVMIGFGFFKYVSIVEVLSVAPFLFQIKNVAVVAAASLLFVLIGVQSVRTGYKKWCVT